MYALDPLHIGTVVASLVAMFEQTITCRPYASPVMHRLAIEGIKIHSLVFVGPEYFTQKLSGIIYIMRIILTDVAKPKDEEMDGTRFHDYFRRMLVDGSVSVYTELTNLRADGMSINGMHYFKPTTY